MCWYKIESKNILLSLQKYFIVLLTMFTFSQQIVWGNISEEIKEEFKKIKQNQICSCCINFQDSDMQFAMALSRENEELKKINEEQQKQLEGQINWLREENEKLNVKNKELNAKNEELRKKLEEQQKQLEGQRNQLEKQNQLEEENKKLKGSNEELEENKEYMLKTFIEMNNELGKLEKKDEENKEIIKNYENEKDKILNTNKDLKLKLEEISNKLKNLDEEYKKKKKKKKKKQYEENDKIIDEYKSQIEEYANKTNQILLENKNLNEQIRNFSSNVNDVDLMKFQQKADENKSRETNRHWYFLSSIPISRR